MEKYVLITGGAGYIGTNLCPKLIKKGYNVVVADNFVNSKPKHIKKLQEQFPGKIIVHKMDLNDQQSREELFKRYKFDGVIHLAGRKYIDESFQKTEEYYKNNVELTKNLLETMSKFDVNKILFASSVSVYGDVKYLPVDENHPLNPLSPYAEHKKECEKIIQNWNKNGEKTAIICRFSNPTGANVDLMLGDDSPTNKSQLIPYMCRKVIANEKLMFNGNTHNTKDGTAVRDFIHITDLTQIVADLYDTQTSSTLTNIARGGDGVSILDVLHSFEIVLNKKLEYGFNPPRQGDIPEITFKTDKLHSLTPVTYTKKLEDTIASQLKFEEYKQQNSSLEF